MASCEFLKIDNGLNGACPIPGGVNKRIWVGNYDDIILTYDSEGYIDTVTMTGSPNPLLYTFVGKDFKHSYTTEGVVGENINTINPTLNMVLNAFTPADREAVEALFKADKLVAFIQRNGGDGKAPIEVIGTENGLRGSAFTGGSGVVLNDSTAVTVSIAGEETTLPKVLKVTSLYPTDAGYLAANSTYLDNLSA